jgi:4-amino-4-deoxy-L-arabinose transferase-like glycosyltransferase
MAGKWLSTPTGGVALLILITLMARLVFAASLGLGIDESYMVAAGRSLHWGYFDHPPASWWMAWVAARLAGTDSPIVVRLPFVLTFALSTWLMFKLASQLFNARAGLWSAVLFNVAPVFGITTASWVLPDGPLLAALLGATCCLVEAFPARGRAAWWWWSAAGACGGIALLSKYSAVLTIFGAVVFLLTQPVERRWLFRPQPYVAGLLALAMFAPVLAWNAQHAWVSFLFQGGRATPGRLHLLGPLTTLGGEAAFLLPWIWLPLALCTLVALRQGPMHWRPWLLACLAAPAILLFFIVSLWSRVLFHWAAPGYLMLIPLLGDAVGRHWSDSLATRVWLVMTAGSIVLGVMLVTSEVRFNWLPSVFENFAPGADPDLAAVDWISLREELLARGLLGRSGLIVAATRWLDAGKIDYALAGRMTVICLGNDPRQYGLTAKPGDYVGDDVLIVAPRASFAQIVAQFGRMFDTIDALSPGTVLHAGRPAMSLPLYLGHRFHELQRSDR